MQNMLEQAKAIEDFIVDFRHQLHMYPELGFQEFRTTEKIEEELKKLGLKYVRFQPTGLMVEIEGSPTGKCVALRADMDALPIQETTGLEYQSRIPEVMHACGHDAHTAMLMGAVKLLYANRDRLKGKVRCIFQPAEEGGGGAEQIIRQGAADGVDMFFGQHVTPLEPAGSINYCPGGAMAAAAKFTIEVSGRSAHGATPEAGIDATLAGCQIVDNLQSIVSRRISPFDTCVLSVCTFNSGKAFNVISDKAVITGTCRFLSKALGPKLKEEMERVCNGVAEAYGAQATVDFEVFSDVVCNDDRVIALVRQAAEKFMDPKMVKQIAPMNAGDDFGAYSNYAPAAYTFLGTEGNGPGHNEKFRIGDESLYVGAALDAQMAVEMLDYLNGENL